MNGYAIVTLPDNVIHGNKVYLAKNLVHAELKEYGYTVDSFNNVLDNGTKVGKIITLSLRAE
jgi:hypothetical protein